MTSPPPSESARPGEDRATAPRPPRLHLGCGDRRLDGWLNLDLQLLPAVDVVADVTRGLCVREAEAVFAEHFLEHLPVDAALSLLEEVHRLLVPGGWLRLSTPNLDWVWKTHYVLDLEPQVKRQAALHLNRAFYGWEHQFIWNRELLAEALEACGFAEVRWCRYGESTLPQFSGLEGHEQSDDQPGLPHVLVVEARKGKPRPAELERLRTTFGEDFLGYREEAQLRWMSRTITRLQQQVGDAEAARAAAAREAHDLRLRIAAMEASRFWKLRNRWFAIKRRLGWTLPGE